MMTIQYPAKERAIRSLLVAPLLPVGILFLLDAVDRAIQFGALYIVGAAMLAFYTLVVVEVFSMVLGGAALAILWGRIPFNLFVCALIGGLVAALPFLIFGLISDGQASVNYDAWVDGRATVIDGVKTSYGRWRDFLADLQIFVLGLIGGGFFWWLCRPKKSAESEVE
jgi:hypothetical protein